MYCTLCGTLRAADAKFCAGCGTQFDEIMNERPEPEQEIAEEIQEAETLENSDASSSEPTPKTPRTPGPKGPPPSRIKDTPPEESMEATSRLDDGTSNGELEEVGFAFASIGKKKIISGMLVSIILLGSIVFFLLDDENDIDIPRGDYISASGEGINLMPEVSCSLVDGIRTCDDGMFLVTYEPDCSESPLHSSIDAQTLWSDQYNDQIPDVEYTNGASRHSCYWTIRWDPGFLKFTAPDQVLEGSSDAQRRVVTSTPLGPRICFDDGWDPARCLIFMEVDRGLVVINDDGECEALISTSEPPYDSMNQDAVADWYSDNENTFDNIRSNFPSECKSTTGPSPIEILLNKMDT